MKSTEHTLHQKLLVPFLTMPEPQGLGWNRLDPNTIRDDGLMCVSSLFTFLEHGNPHNTFAWKKLVQQQKELIQQGSGSHKIKPVDLAKEKIIKALDEALYVCEHTPELLRSGFSVEGVTFLLWNEPYGRGHAASEHDRFQQNIFDTASEVIFYTPERKTKRRVDQAFYVNGLLYAVIEVKARQTKQSAKDQGVHKLASDVRLFSKIAFDTVKEAYQATEGQPWPGLESEYSKPVNATNAKWQRDVKWMTRCYTKPAWLAALDGQEMWLAPDVNEWLLMIDPVSSQLKSMHSIDANAQLNLAMLEACSQLPPVTAPEGWEQIERHVTGMLSKMGVAREIMLWHSQRREKAQQTAPRSFQPLLLPRAPQRVALHEAFRLIDTYYTHEHDPTWMQRQLEQHIRSGIPALRKEEIDNLVQEQLLYKNGQDAYSVLIQGAAGLGKTNIAIWLALALYKEWAPLLPGQVSSPHLIREPLFDHIILITDRVELRQNLADEANRSKSSQHQILDVEDHETLVAALTGAPLPNHQKGQIWAVNVHKFMSIYDKIKSDEITLSARSGRVAFIIDEIHRSQNGSMHEASIQSFVEGLSALSHSSQHTKRNLIVGLSATPSDLILARFGTWHPALTASDTSKWVPHFVYGMKQAIKDGYVLNPMQGYTRLTVPLDIAVTETLNQSQGQDKVKLKMDDVYEHEGRQREVARKFSELFVTITMKAIPQARVNVGRGKAMVACHSVRAAISMGKLIREELKHLADHAKGKEWEKSADLIREIAEQRVFILYSNSMHKQGQRVGDCGEYNEQFGHIPTEKEIIDGFRCVQAGSVHTKRNSIMVVVDKLLTGFDEPSLHTLLLDRNLHDSTLFQAMCRVNRKMPRKDTCLVLDASHEGLQLEAQRVFERFGGMARTKLDGLTLFESVEAKRKLIQTLPGFKLAWKGQSQDGPEDLLLHRQQWVSQFKDDVQEHQRVRKLLGGYLRERDMAEKLVWMPTPDHDRTWLGVVKELHQLMHMDQEDEEVSSVLFEVGEIGLDEDVVEQLKTGSKPKAPPEPTKHVAEQILDSLIQEESSPSDPILETLEDLQTQEMLKQQRIEDIKGCLEDLFQRMAKMFESHNNNEFGKLLFDPEQNQEALLKLFMSKFDFVLRQTSQGWKPEQKIYKPFIQKHHQVVFGEYRVWYQQGERDL